MKQALIGDVLGSGRRGLRRDHGRKVPPSRPVVRTSRLGDLGLRARAHSTRPSKWNGERGTAWPSAMHQMKATCWRNRSANHSPLYCPRSSSASSLRRPATSSRVKLLRNLQAECWFANMPGFHTAAARSTARVHVTGTTYSARSVPSSGASGCAYGAFRSSDRKRSA